MRFDPSAHSVRGERSLVVIFLDLKGFAAQAARIGDAELAEHVEAYYRRVGEQVAGAGGHVIKFIGDGALVVFDRAAADTAVEAMLALKRDIDAWLDELRWPCSL